MKQLHRFALFAVTCLIATPLIAQTFQLPTKTTPRPQTTNGVPHTQINVRPVPALSAELLRRVATLPGVEVRNTIISLPGAKGFWIAENTPLTRPDAIVLGREFAHIHSDGSLHAALEPNTARKAIEAGWAISHPWARSRANWGGFVMIYTPQNIDELEVVYALIVDSYNFVTSGRSTID